MAAFNFHRRKTRRWWYAGATVVAVAFFTVFYVGGAFAVTGSPSNFESADGNMTLQASGNTDWNCFQGANGFATLASGTPAGCAKTSGATQVSADLPTSVGEVTWTKGQKFDTACPTLATKSTPPKDDFTNVAEYAEFGGGNLFFYGASIRSTANGNTSGDIEFNQNAGNGTSTFGCRTAGDRLVAYDFLNGGTSLDFHALTWIDAGHPNLGNNNGTCLVKNDTLPCWGATVIHVAAGEFDGQANQSGIANTDNGMSGTTLVAQQFAEFGVNLTQALGGGQLPCFPQQVWESRSSGSSFVSSPEDLEFASVNTCGSIKIIKHTLDGTGTRSGVNKDFTYTSTGGLPAPTSFTLNDGAGTDTLCPVTSGTCNTQYDNGNVNVGPYTVSEGAEPSGFSFVSLTCVDSGGNNTTTSGGTASITVAANGLTTCTYVNQKNTAALTTQQQTATGTVFPGTSVTDKATVTGNQSTLTPSGTVTFSLCGPLASATGCSSNDGSAGTGSLNGSGGTASATSSAVNTSGSPLAVGIYCFEASWPGDTNYPGALNQTGASNECFTVKKDNTATVTTPGDSSGTNPESSIILGGTIYDTAVVTGTTAGGTPTGNVVFHECGPIAAPANCATGGTLVGDPGGVALGAPTTATSATAISAGFTPQATGRYCFRGDYGGSLVYNGSSDPSNTTAANECFTVTQISTGTVTKPSVGQNGTTTFGDTTVMDTAVISANASGGGPITGTVDFFLCSPSQMAALSESTCVSGGTGSGSTMLLTDLVTSPPSASATSDAFTSGVNQTGTWCWRAVYTPGGTDGSQYTGSSDSKSTECFTVTDTTSGNSAQTWMPNDTGNVSSVSGAPLNGTLSIQLYSNADCGVAESGGGAVLLQLYQTTLTGTSSSASLTTTNMTYAVTTSTSVSWLVTFTSTDPNVTGFSHCESSSVTVTN
jgi:hypothetical protein